MKTRLFENFDFDGKGLSIATGTGILWYKHIKNPVSLYYSALCYDYVTFFQLPEYQPSGKYQFGITRKI